MSQIAPPPLTLYNPAVLDRDDLVAQFVVRQALLERLLDDLRRTGTGQGAQHHLLVGQRGMGKTTILRRLAYAVEDDPALASRWLPLLFPEEQYNVARLSDLWVNCLDALGAGLEVQGDRNAAADLDRLIDALPGDEGARASASRNLLLDRARQLDRGLLLLLDNADLVLDRLGEDQWALREALSGNERLVVIGATSAAIESTYHYGKAFYDFFRVHEIRGLSFEESFALLRSLAKLRRSQGVASLLDHDAPRLRALHHLTGGNPRTLVLLYQVLDQDQDADLRTHLDRLFDQCTPLYKARFEALPAQLQLLVDALALNWHPMTAAELAADRSVRFEVNQVSAQLNRLGQLGVVEKVALPGGRRTGFQIAERFFNIWYLMRASRRVRRRLVWLVEFLHLFYSQDELRRRGLMLRRHSSVDPDRGIPWSNLGNLLMTHPGRFAEGEVAYRRALELDTADSHALNGLAWCLHLTGREPSEAEARARHAVGTAPDNVYMAHTLACILEERGLCDQAHELARRFLGDQEFVAKRLPAVLHFFGHSVASGHGADAAQLMVESGAAERFAPLHEALVTAASGSRSRLLLMAPEVREATEEVLRVIAPDLAPLEARPFPRRRSRRRRV